MEFFTDSPELLLYLGVLFGPFVQEDAAVIAAATLSVTQMAKTAPVFVTICIGLFLSDIWKYWIGWAALRNKNGKSFAQKKKVINLQEKVLRHTLTTLIAARFIPLTRIPIYMACGFFGVSYLKFCLYIALTAILYVSVIFATFHVLGSLIGEHVMWVLPATAITILIGIIVAKSLKNKNSTQGQ